MSAFGTFAPAEIAQAQTRASSRQQAAKQFVEILRSEEAAQRLETAIFKITNDADSKE